MAKDADYIVVGGGVYGAAATYELAARGHSVVLLERDAIASGASGGAGKRGIRAAARDSRELPVASAALRAWPGLAEKLDAELGFEPLGGLWLIESVSETGHIGLAAAHAQAELLNAHGIPAHLIDRDELVSLETDVAPEVAGAIYCKNDAIASQTMVTQAYLRAAQARGAEVRERSQVLKTFPGPRPGVRIESGETLHAAKGVLVAVNSYTPDLVDAMASVPMWRMAPQGLFVRSTSGYQPRHLIGHLSQPLSLKPIQDDITMISGGMRGIWNDAEDAGRVVDEQVTASLRLAGTVVPALQDAELLRADAGRPEGYMPDAIPVIDEWAQGIYVVAGWHGHGFALVPRLSELLVSWLTTGTKPHELVPFCRERLGYAQRTLVKK